MEQSTALNKLLESADLIRMLEDLTSPGSIEKLSGASLSGLRLTLRNVRDAVLTSHDALAQNFVTKTVQSNENSIAQAATADSAKSTEGKLINRTEIVTGSSLVSDSQRMQMTRRDLRASFEKMVDR